MPKPLFGLYGKLYLIQRQNRFFRVIGCGPLLDHAISDCHVPPAPFVVNMVPPIAVT
jgi:hypothetical protein